MPFSIIRNDITKVRADAIVNTANPHPVIGDGTDSAVYMAAGMEQLLNERQKIGDIPVGSAAVTSGFRLPARYIIHTVGPVWKGGLNGEADALRSCYSECLRIARDLDLGSIAFPLISSGYYGFPKDVAIEAASSVIYEFLMENDMEVYLVVYDRESYLASERYSDSISSYIDDNYHDDAREEMLSDMTQAYVRPRRGTLRNEAAKAPIPFADIDISEHIKSTEKTFQEHLLELIIKKDLRNSDVYHGANITKQHFSKLISNRHYHPTKNTACALAISLHLTLDEARDLLERAGFVLSRSSRFDLAVEYFLMKGMYNIVEDNIILYENGLESLGTL